jgi:heme a synthase
MGERLTISARQIRISSELRGLVVLATGLIFLQLVMGATMRHQHAGLAVPDFPLAYGKLWPPTDPAFLEQIHRQRLGIHEYKPVTAFHILLHMAHRIGVLLIVTAVGVAAWLARREQGRATVIARGTAGWLILLGVQATLGAATVWTNKAADVATAHVLAGALSLLIGAVLSTVVIAAGARSHVPAALARSVRPAPPGPLAQPGPAA